MRAASLVDAEQSALAELADVERALASLEGRDTGKAQDMVLARRDAEKRRGELEQLVRATRSELQARKRRQQIGLAAGGLFLLFLAGLGATLWPKFRSQSAKRDTATAATEAFSAPFSAAGFRVGETAWGPGEAVVQGAKGQCFIVVAASTWGSAHLKVKRELSIVEADTSVGWCSCGPERVQVTSSGSGPIAVHVLSAPARQVGGADMLAATTPHPAAVVAETVDRACAEASLDEYLAAARPASADKPAPTTKEESALLQVGMTLVTVGAADTPFLGVPAAKDSCFLARSRSPESDALSLRIKGGGRPVAGKRDAVAFCARSPEGLSVWHDGKGAVALFSMASAKAGGLLGLRDLATRAAVPTVGWVAGDDLVADARDTLQASGVGPSYVLEATAFAQAALVALSTDEHSTLAIEDKPGRVACRPAVKQGVAQALCLVPQPGAWTPLGELPTGTVLAKRPSWLPLSPTGGAAQLQTSLDLLAFARRMTAEGFEVTALTGATSTADGAEIIGRAGDKEVVAVALTLQPPFLHTLSDAAPWSLYGAPRAVPLAPGKTVRLRATPPPAGAPSSREILVFRR